MEVDAVEDAAHDVGVAADDRPGVGEGVGFEHYEGMRRYSKNL